MIINKSNKPSWTKEPKKFDIAAAFDFFTASIILVQMK